MANCLAGYAIPARAHPACLPLRLGLGGLAFGSNEDELRDLFASPQHRFEVKTVVFVVGSPS